MNWLPIRNQDGGTDRYAIRSECGRYTVCRVMAGGHWYEAWHGKERLGWDREAHVAKGMCEKHERVIPEVDFANVQKGEER